MLIPSAIPCGRLGRFFAGLLLGLLALPLFAQTPVTLQLRWHHQFQFAGYYAALHKGFYSQEGLEVSFREGGPGISPVDEVTSGRAEFGVSNAGLVNAYLNGKPVLMLAPIFQHSPSVLLFRDTGKAPTPSNLAQAGTILLLGSDEDVELKAMFVNEGIPLDKIQFATGGQHLEDLLAGRVAAINAYLSNEPFLLKERGFPYSTLRPQNYGMDFYSDVLFTRRDLEQQSPATVAAFRRASLRGWEYALQNPDEIIDLILRSYNPKQKSRAHLEFEARTLAELIAPDLVQIGHSNPGRWQHIAQAFVDFKLAPPGKSLDGFFYHPDTQADYGWLKAVAALLGLGALLLGLRSAVLAQANTRLTTEIEAREAAQRDLSEAHAKLTRFADIIDEHVMITRTDREGRIVEVTSAFCRQTGFERDGLLGTELARLFDRKALGASRLLDTLQAGRFWQGEIKTLRRDGSYFWADVSINPVKGEDGSLVEMTAFHVDATARKTIEQLSRLDGLTGLLNRRTFIHEAEALLRSTPSPWVAVAMIDADFFKRINDTWGHLTGDRALQGIARELTVLQQQTGALTGRFGGEEFVVLFPIQQGLEPLPALECFMDRVRALRIPSQDEADISFTVSIGVDGQPSRAARLEDLLNRADQSLYQAKFQGRDRICVSAGLAALKGSQASSTADA